MSFVVKRIDPVARQAKIDNLRSNTADSSIWIAPVIVGGLLGSGIGYIFGHYLHVGRMPFPPLCGAVIGISLGAILKEALWEVLMGIFWFVSWFL